MSSTPQSAGIASRAFTSHGTTYAKGAVVPSTGYSDAEFQRLRAQGMLVSAGVGLVKAGAVTDADFSGPPPNGTTALDTTNGRLYIRAAVPEQQTITLASVTGGTFTVSFGGKTTTAITASASLPTAATLQAALRALSSIGSSGVSVAGSAGGPFTLTFNLGPWGDNDVAQVTCDNTNLTGSGYSITPATTVAGGGWKYTALT